MNDYLFKIEHDIETVVDEYAIDESNRNLIEEGRQSVLRGKYGLDFDTCSTQWCFRSAKTEELTRSEYFASYRYELGKSNGDAATIIKRVLMDIRSAVNNDIYNKDKYLSYSKNLAAPLFKYYGGSPGLIIDQLNLNSIDIQIGMHCFDWVPTYDINGEKCNRNYIDDVEISIPFTELFSKEKMLSHINEREEILNDLKSGMMDIDYVELAVLELTFDISINSRNNFDKYYRENGGWFFKRLASYMMDGEVLTTRSRLSSKALIIKDSDVLQFVRFIYFVKIGNWDSDKLNTFINNVIANNLVEVAKLEEGEQAAVRWILEYFKNGGRKIEQEVYRKMFQKKNAVEKYKYPPCPPSGLKPSHVKQFVEFLRKDLAIFHFFKKDFLDRIIPYVLDV